MVLLDLEQAIVGQQFDFSDVHEVDMSQIVVITEHQTAIVFRAGTQRDANAPSADWEWYPRWGLEISGVD